jgi:hypothetical protein
MPLITDVDLLTIEPSIFLDATAAATKLMSGSDGVIAGTTLTSAASSFVAASIDAGHVAVVAGEALEIVQRTSATTLSVSRPRPATSTLSIAPNAGSSLAFTIWTFQRLIELAEQSILAALAIDADHPTQPLQTDAILNHPAVERIVATAAIARVCAVAAAADPASETLKQRASDYVQELERLRQQLIVVLDLDGDGVADATRRIAVACVVRM